MEWAIVEVMGHRRYAGQIEEIAVAGVPMLRVHVPAFVRSHRETEWRAPSGDACSSWDSDAQRWERTVEEHHTAYTVDLGGASLFAVTRCSEDRAREAARVCHLGPEAPEETTSEWRLRNAPQLAGPVVDAHEIAPDGEE